ncbi:hypothetical protein SteCoe_33507 [Stentor coeruleus]|uniref:non-specific serine/threonine protein kinase n=1 Tax=Stentor coeruleus TaxID=5963 RepID=A0A1R2AWL2_9CILI|nr:hypothetical protein SteCoe_33507 [Stentor coeruleus]
MENLVVLKRQWFIFSKKGDIAEEYDLGLEIGSGTYGKVFLAEHKASGIVRAIKLIHKDRIKEYETFTTEFTILKDLDHPNIVNIIETFETDLYCFVVLEYCSGGELFHKLCKQKTFSEQQAAKVMKSLISAVMYCHNHGICHRDLKPENCLYLTSSEDSDLKIIDFGLSVAVTEEQILHELNGTPYYIAPEILMGNYTKVVDCWSIGVIMYMLLSGTPPFKGKDNNEILMNVYSGSFTFRPKAFKVISNVAKDLIVRLLTKDPAYRITAQQAFMHPWIQELNPAPYRYLSETVLLNISSFIKANPIKQITLSYIASKLAGTNIEHLRGMFIRVDSNGDGVVSKDEFTKVIQQSSSLKKLDIEVACRFLDTNRKGAIDYNEFIAGTLLRESLKKEQWVKQAFDYFDKDKCGFITVQDLKNSLSEGECTTGISKEDIEKIIKLSDENNDGKLDFKEFSEHVINSSETNR